jgi:hypothetical protein
MSKEAKVYLNKFNSVKSSEYGFGVYIKSVDELYQELKANANADGSIRLYVSKKQTPDKFGNDGTVTLNTWKPTPGAQGQGYAKPQAAVYTPQPVSNQQESEDDLPF